MRFLIAALSLLAPGAASAHAILMQSQPEAESSVPAGPTPLVLRFNSRIDRARSRLTLRGPGAELTPSLRPDSPADTLETAAALAPGPWVLHWQVLAVDGHITRGDLRFTVQAR
jgi:methionine-rich copper-binding protein CopC